MKLQHIIGIGIIALFGVTVLAQDATPIPEPNVAQASVAVEKKIEAKAQTLCPIEGAKIDKSQCADVEGCRIYGCCKECVDKIKADPKAAMKKITDKGEICECVCCKCGGAMAKTAACPADSMQCAKCKAMQKMPTCCGTACPMKAKDVEPQTPPAPAPAK